MNKNEIDVALRTIQLESSVNLLYPKCPECGNSLNNTTPDGSPELRRCANCKHVWHPCSFCNGKGFNTAVDAVKISDGKVSFENPRPAVCMVCNGTTVEPTAETLKEVNPLRKVNPLVKSIIDLKRGGYATLPILQFLWGKELDKLAMGFVHSVRPSEVRVSRGSIFSDSKLHRVTIFINKENIIKRIEQEVEVRGGTGYELKEAFRKRYGELP